MRQAFLDAAAATCATPPRSTATGTGASCRAWRCRSPARRSPRSPCSRSSRAWNQYLWPLIVTKDDRCRTVQIGLKQLQPTSIDQINVTFAGTVIAALPLLILLLVFQKHLVRGLTAGAVKG